MTIRMSSLQYMYNYKVGLNRAYEKQTKLFEQADGSSIHRGSDDPIAYSKLLRYNVSQAENEQYQKNVNNAVSLMKTETATLDNMTTRSKTIVEKTIQAANTYNTSADFESIAKEMFSSIEEIMSLCNTQQGDRYIFAGQKDITEPFTMSAEEKDRGVAKTLDAAQTKFFKGKPSEGDSFVYQMLALKVRGENGLDVEYCLDTETGYVYTKEFVEEGYKELVTMDYLTVFEAQEDTTSGKSTVAQELLAAGTANYDNPIKVSDSGTGLEVITYFDSSHTDTEVFSVSDFFDNKGIVKDYWKEVYDTSTNELIATVATSDTTYDNNSSYNVIETPRKLVFTVPERDSEGNIVTTQQAITDDNGNPVLDDNGDPTYKTVTSMTTLRLSFDSIKQRVVTYSGDINSIEIVKHNGATDLVSDVVNVMGEDIFHTDIFDDANSGNKPSGTAFLNDMISVYNKVLAEDVDWLNSDGVGLSNAAHNSITLSQTTIGARTQLYESVGTMLDSQGTYITDDITNVSGTDVAELATRLMEMTALYNMALSIGGRILPVSLADYL